MARLPIEGLWLAMGIRWGILHEHSVACPLQAQDQHSVKGEAREIVTIPKDHCRLDDHSENNHGRSKGVARARVMILY